MKEARKIIIMILVLTMAVAVLFSGCKPAKRPSPTRYTPPAPRTAPLPRTTPAPRTTPGPGTTMPTPGTTPVPTPSKRPTPDSIRAAKIAMNVAKIPEVNKATVVISGNTAIVGIDMKSKVQGAHETDVKKKVEKTVRDTDKGIKHVSTTSDPDLYTRLTNISKGIAAGRPLSEFTKQITEILKRITPSA